MSSPNAKSVRFFQPAEEPAEIDESAWDRARNAIEKLKRAYVEEWAPASLDELERVLTIASSSPEVALEQIDAAYRLAHDMKGQGATFGFVLISDIGTALCAMTQDRSDATPAELQAMLAHVDAAREIIGQEIEDPEGADAVAVMRKLQTAIRANLH